MNDSELKKILLETCPVRPGQEDRAWNALREQLFVVKRRSAWSWLYYPTWRGLSVAVLVLASIPTVGYLLTGQPIGIATADSQSPGIYATAFYSKPAQAQVVWLNGMEPLSDKPTYLDPSRMLPVERKVRSRCAIRTACNRGTGRKRCGCRILFAGRGDVTLMMRMSLSVAVLILAFSGLGLGASFAGEKIWVGLYQAENEPPPPGVVLAPEKLHEQLRAVFGFHHYVLIQAQDVEMRNEWEQWFVPRTDFFIRLEPLRRVDAGPRMIDYEIYKDGFIVAKGMYEPREGTPLFINGPDYHRGRLILVLDRR